MQYRDGIGHIGTACVHLRVSCGQSCVQVAAPVCVGVGEIRAGGSCAFIVARVCSCLVLDEEILCM